MRASTFCADRIRVRRRRPIKTLYLSAPKIVSPLESITTFTGPFGFFRAVVTDRRTLRRDKVVWSGTGRSGPSHRRAGNGVGPSRQRPDARSGARPARMHIEMRTMVYGRRVIVFR
jgi:hypothetical protein